MEKLIKETFDRWKDWMNKIIDDLQQLVNYQQIYKYFIDTVNSNIQHINENQGALFCNFVRECFAIYSAAGIRRHARSHPDSISLMGLLEQLKKSANQFTYEFYIEQYPIDSNSREWQKITFEYFSDDKKNLSESIIKKDIQEIKDIADKVRNFADVAIAHLDKNGIIENITYKNVTDSVDLFNKICCKYSGLITSSGYVTLQPSILGDWKKIFTVPLDIRKYE